MFEIELVVRNGLGDPICRSDGSPLTRRFESDSAYKVYEFFQKNRADKKYKSSKMENKNDD